MKIKKTYLDLFNFEYVGNDYIAKMQTKSEAPEALIEDKLCTQIKNVFKQIVKIREGYDEAIDRLQTNNCLTFPEGHKFHRAIMYEEVKLPNGQINRQKQFSPAGELKLKADIKLLLNETVEIHSRIPDGISDLIKDLTETELSAFSEIVIPKQELKQSED